VLAGTGPEVLPGRLHSVQRIWYARLSAAPPARVRSAGREDGISRGRPVCRIKGVTTVPEVRIAAEPRTEFGKGAARRTRREGRVPAIVYGHGTETRHISLPGHDLMMALKTPNVLIRIDGLPGGNQLALPKAVQRDPIRGSVEHVDLIMVRRGEKVTVDVPVQVTGEVFSGGLLDQQLVQVAVEAEATNIPNAIEVDIEGMEIGAAIHAGDLALPAGVTLVVDPEALVLHVLAAPTAEQIEAELGEVPAAEEAEEVPPSPEAPAQAAAAPDAEATAEQSG
jgi:large subunit ribosomal protein L25